MDKTKIDWCDSTWNPVTGCLHGCEYCYARRIAERFAGFEPGENGEWNMIQYKKEGERLGISNGAQYKIANGKKICLESGCRIVGLRKFLRLARKLHSIIICF